MSLRRQRRGKAARGSIVAVSQKTCPSSHANGAPDRVRGRSGIFRASTLGDVTTVAARSLVTAASGSRRWLKRSIRSPWPEKWGQRSTQTPPHPRPEGCRDLTHTIPLIIPTRRQAVGWSMD